jgi:S-DNA-T family DNA segregation ATPase FtsK/SpoIIIE
MASLHARQRDPLLDQNTQALLERRGRELLGLVLLAVALAFALMLGSYSPEDPGWMVATEDPARNLMGRFGAALSSTFIIVIGQGAWMIPLTLGAWGLRFVLHRGAERAVGRIVFAVIAVALASVFASTLLPGADWPHAFGLGGLFGDTVAGTLVNLLPLGAGLGLNLLSLILGLALAVLGLWVTGFTLAELAGLGRFLMMGSIFAYDSALGLMGRGTARAAQAVEARRMHKAEATPGPRDARRAGDWAPEPMSAPRGAAMAVPVAMGRVQRAEAATAQADWRQDRVPPVAEPPRPALRADPRYPEPMAEAAHYAPPREKAGLLGRMPQLMRRIADPEPEPELVEPALPDSLAPDAPTDDRIKARISDAIRSRVRQGAPALGAGSTGSTAAAAMRREPPVMRSLTQRLRGPQPLIADTRRPVAPGGLPVEPPLTTAMAATLPAMGAGLRSTPPQWNPSEGQGDAPAWDEDALAAPPAPPTTFVRPVARRHDQADAPALEAPPLEAYETEADWMPDHVREAEEPHPRAAHDADVDEALDDGFDDAFDTLPPPAPVRPPLVAAPRIAPVIETRRAVVQHPAKKPVAPSSRATAEAQPRLRFDEQMSAPYELPPLSLLTSPTTITRHQLSDEALEENARMLESVLDDYGVKGEIVSVRPGPVVTMYELEPAPGLKASRVIGLADDIARSMSALSARVSTVPGRSVIGIELPNVTREKVVLREIIAAREFGDSAMRLPLALGKDIGGAPVIANLAKMPHLLIAGTTGSGKSVAINTMILSLLYKLTPEECRLIMIDPKMLELSVYDGIPHLLSPVVTDPKKAVVALKWVVGEMEERYRKMSKMGVRNIEGYNGRVREALAKGELFKRTVQTGFDDETGEPVFETEAFEPQPFPYIVVIVDEMADLMMVAGKEIEACIQRLAQMARASGIHLIMATQRPSVDVITGTIKANFPTRISFQVTSKIDSRTILGEQGAEQLLGQGDMLYMGNGAKITRIHGPFVSDEEVEEIVNHLKSFGPPTYMSGVVEGPDEDKADDIDMVLGLGGGDGEDALYDQAVAIVAKDRKCSTSYIQRKLGIGYNKAARLVEQMEEQGVVTPANHVGKREILVPET